MTHTWYTSMSYARNLIHTFEAVGLDAGRVLREAELDRTALNAPDARLSEAQKVALWEGALAQTDDPYFGLHVGMRAPLGRWGLVEFIVMNSRTLEDALENSIRYIRLMGEAKEATLMQAGQEVRYVLSMRAPMPPPYRHVLESDLIYMLRLIRHVLSPSFTPRALWFPHALHGEAQVYERMFQAAVHFEQPALAMVFDAEWLDRPIVSANPHLQAPLEVEAARVLSKLDAMETLSERIATLLQLDPGRMTLDDVGERLGVGARTLQRRLKEEGTSFRTLQDEARRQHALVHLQNPDVPLGEISYRLGYSERSAFYRAVKRWLGMTAQEYRTSAQADVS